MKTATFGVNRTGMSLSAAFGSVYLLCLLVVGVSPDTGMMMYQSTFHMSAPMYPTIGLEFGIVGLFLAMAIGYIIGAVFAATYKFLGTE